MMTNGKERTIRRVLRRKHSQQYFTGTGSGWTQNPDEARNFSDSVEAAQACVHCGLSGVEIVLRVHGAAADLFCTELI